MKKISVMLMLLAIVGAAAFAQDAKAAPPKPNFGMWDEADLYLLDSHNDWGWGTKWWQANPQGQATGFYHSFTVSYDAADSGYFALLDFQSKGTGASLLSAYDAYYKLFGGKAQITVGALRLGDYWVSDAVAGNPAYARLTGSGGATPAAQIKLTPIDNLSVTVDTAVGDVDGTISGNTSQTYLTSTGFAAQYTIPNMASIVVQYRNEDMGDNNWIFGGITTGKNVSKFIGTSVSINAVKNYPITIANDYRYGDPSISGGSAFGWVSVSGPLGPLSTALTAAWNYNNAWDKNGVLMPLTYLAEANAEYNLGPVSVGANFGYDTTGVGWFAGSSGSGLEIYPYVKAGFASGSIKAGFEYTSATTSTLRADTPASYWTIPVKFVSSF